MNALAGVRGERPLFLMQRVLASVSQGRGIGTLFSPPWRPLLSPAQPAELRASFPGGPAAPWAHQQVRAKARGNEYQPSNLRRKHKHGWIRRIRSPSGIEVILRRMLKGRQSLTH